MCSLYSMTTSHQVIELGFLGEKANRNPPPPLYGIYREGAARRP
jgi:hypothetical protein